MLECYLLRFKVGAGQMCRYMLCVHTEVYHLPYLYILGHNLLSMQLPALHIAHITLVPLFYIPYIY